MQSHRSHCTAVFWGQVDLPVMNKLTFKSAPCPPEAAGFVGVRGLNNWPPTRKKSQSSSLRQGLNSATPTLLARFVDEMAVCDAWARTSCSVGLLRLVGWSVAFRGKVAVVLQKRRLLASIDAEVPLSKRLTDFNPNPSCACLRIQNSSCLRWK